MTALVEKNDNKSVSRSVSMPESRWGLVEVRAPLTPGKDRSGYITALVEADLRAAGLLPKTENEGDMELVQKVVAATSGDTAARAEVEKTLRRIEANKRKSAK